MKNIIYLQFVYCQNWVLWANGHRICFNTGLDLTIFLVTLLSDLSRLQSNYKGEQNFRSNLLKVIVYKKEVIKLLLVSRKLKMHNFFKFQMKIIPINCFGPNFGNWYLFFRLTKTFPHQWFPNFFKLSRSIPHRNLSYTIYSDSNLGQQISTISPLSVLHDFKYTEIAS